MEISRGKAATTALNALQQLPGRINVKKTSEQYFQLLPPTENQKSCSIGQILEYKVG